MRRFFARLLIGAVIVAASYGLPVPLQGHSSVVPPVAEAGHNGPWLPGDIMDWPVQRRAFERGYITYCFDAYAGAYPGFREQAAQVASVAVSRGSLLAAEIPWGAGCDVRNQAPAPAAFDSLCGAGFAYACVYYWRDPVDIYYDLQGPNAAVYNNGVICHEGGTGNTGHVMFLHEQYDDVNGRSNGKSWTCMDFGVRDPEDPARTVWMLKPWDRDRIFDAGVPARPSSVGLVVPGNGYAYVTWTQDRADNGALHLNGIKRNSNATRVALAVAPDRYSAPTWLGVFCGPAANFCYTPYSQGWAGVRIADFPGCLYMRAENAAFWWVHQLTAPDYWTLAGCTRD